MKSVVSHMCNAKTSFSSCSMVGMRRFKHSHTIAQNSISIVLSQLADFGV